MREIKFRIFDKQYKKLIYITGFRYCNDKIKYTLLDSDGDYCTYTRPINIVCIEQYTGLKDKNGVEIYEGDIVKGSIQCGTNNAYGVGEVHWSDDYCGWLITITNDDCAMYEVSMNDIGELEVIGNIHESEDN